MTGEVSQNNTNETTEVGLTTEEKLYGKEDVQKPEEEKTEVESKEEVKEESKEVEYKIDLGDDLVLEPKELEEIVSFAKEQGFSNEVANKIAQRENSLLSNFIKTQEADHEATVNGWSKAIKDDKEFGGEKFNDSVNYSHQVINRFATPEFKQLLNETGYGNHPELFKVFAKIGQAMKNDSTVFGEKNNSNKKSVEELFYGKNE